MDIFTTTTFILLSITVGVNIIVGILERKQALYPLYIFQRDLTMYILRVCWIPMVILIFIITFDIRLVFIRVFLYIALVICLTNGVLKIPYLQRSFKTSVLLLRAKEKKINAISQNILKLDGGDAKKDDDANDNGDNEEEDHLLHNAEQFKENFKIEGVDDEPPSEKDVLKQKAKQFKLSRLEVFVLKRTEHFYNSAASLAEVFGVAGLQNFAENALKSAADAAKAAKAVADKAIVKTGLRRASQSEPEDLELNRWSAYVADQEAKANLETVVETVNPQNITGSGESASPLHPPPSDGNSSSSSSNSPGAI
jgi:hypothetical protein